MGKLYITEHTHSKNYRGELYQVVEMPPVVTQVLAVGTSSITCAVFNDKTRIVAVHTDSICSVEFGTAPTATVNSRRMAANTTEYFMVNGSSKIATITNT